MSFLINTVNWIAREVLAPIAKAIVAAAAPVIASLVVGWIKVRFAPAAAV